MRENACGLGLPPPPAHRNCTKRRTPSLENKFIRSRASSPRSLVDRRARTLFQIMNCVHTQSREFFRQSARPADFNPLETSGSPKPKVHAHIVVGIVAGAAAHFVHQDPVACLDTNLGSDPVAI